MKIKVSKLPSVREFGKKYEPIETQEKLLRVRAHVNAQVGNSLLSKWMSESADRLTNLREVNELVFTQLEADREPPKSPVINQNDPFEIVRFDVQGDALYDDEPSYTREPFILPKYPIDEDVTDNPNYNRSEYPLWDFVTRCAPEQLSSVTNPALYEMMKAYKD